MRKGNNHNESNNKKTMFFKILIFSSMAIISTTAIGGIDGDLGNFFNGLGYEGNYTQGSAYQGQQAGYYSGGSAFLRNRVRSAQLISLEAPSWNSGCGGIDLFLGGFSFISGKEIINMFKTIMTNSTGYAMQLALETAVPEIAHVLKEIQDMAQKINNLNINSCDSAEALVGGLWPKTRASQQKICQDLGRQRGDFADWAAARQGCGVEGKFNKHMEMDDEHSKNYKGQIVVNKNIIWQTIKRNGFLSSDNQLAELYMSLSGTIIYDAKGQSKPYSSVITDRKFIAAFLYGGTANNVYKCNEFDKCLIVTRGDITINKDKSLVEQTSKMIQGLIKSVKEDGAITNEQKGFLNTVNVPVLKFITVMLSLKHNYSVLKLVQYSELIAEELLVQYLNEALEVIRHSLAVDDYSPELQKQLTDKIHEAQLIVTEMENNAHKKIQDMTVLIKEMQFVEQQVISRLSTPLKNNLTSGDK